MREISGGILCSECVNKNIPKTVPHQLNPGTVLNGKYLVGNVIGEGGFGITYIGRDTVLDTKVAIKEFYPTGHINRNNQISSNLNISTEDQRNFISKGREQFLDEARKIAQFSSEPGIVNVKDFFEENETAYIIMEYLEGKTLASYIKECGPMDADKVQELMIPLIRALSKIHKLGVIHRDISPDNIMYLDEGTCKLMDFGSARYFMGQNQELTSTVKRGYAPEEQYTSTGRQGPWTDVYGLCATIYKCITGATPADAIDRMSYDSLKSPSQLGVRVKPEFEQIIMRGLALHAQDRCQDMDELLQLIQGISQRKAEAAEDEDVTMYADQTYFAQDDLQTFPGSNTQNTYTQKPYTQEPRTDTMTGGYGQQRTYRTQEHTYSERAYGGRKKKNILPAVIGGIAIVAAAGFIFWNIAGKGGEEAETIGDYYVTGCKEVLKVREKENEDSKVLAKLDNGEKVSLIERTAEDSWKVYVESEEVTGYLNYHYLIDEREAAMEPEDKIVNTGSGEQLTILNAPRADGTSVGILGQGDEVTVLAMPGDNFAYIYAPESKAYGYVEKDKLSGGQGNTEVSMTVLSGEPSLSDFTKVSIAGAEASTEYIQPGYDNSAWAAFDGNATTSWQEAAGGSGIGEWILGRFDAAYNVKYIGLKLGNWRDRARFLGNNRPTELEVSIGGYSSTLCFSDEMTEQWIELSQPCPASEIKLTIRNICRGDNGQWNEGCISEIRLYAQ